MNSKTENELAQPNQNVDVRRGSDADLIPSMVCTPAEMKRRLQDLQQFVKDVMVEGIDYGPPFPGSDKRVLLKPGAEKLAEIYGYAVEPRITQRIEIWDPPHGPFFSYEFESQVYSKRSGIVIGKGFGSCNTREARYRWRTAGRTCPKCKKEDTIIKGKREYGGGFVCFGKKGGCGAKFTDNDPEIISQDVGRVENDDICTLANTALKIGKKRSYLDAVISVTQSSGLFTGEDDDDDVAATENGHGGKPQRNAPRSQQARQPQQQQATPPRASKPADGRHLEVTIRGKAYRTAGITAETLVNVWNVLKAYNEANPDIPDAGKVKMQELTGKNSSLDLPEDEGRQLIKTVQAILDGAPGDPSPADDEIPY